MYGTTRNGHEQKHTHRHVTCSCTRARMMPLSLSEHLEPLLILVGHVTALELRLFGPRFDVYGPWAHAY